MKHPLQSIKNQRQRIFFILLGLTLLTMITMNLLGNPLVNAAAPYGIISLELAGNSQRAAQIIRSWDQQEQITAGFLIGLDFLFLALYSTTIGLGCIWARDVLAASRWPLTRFGIPLAWGQWLAAVLDVLENISLMIILLASTASPWPELARGFAVIKFGLVFLGMVYVFLALATHLTKKLL